MVIFEAIRVADTSGFQKIKQKSKREKLNIMKVPQQCSTTTYQSANENCKITQI